MTTDPRQKIFFVLPSFAAGGAERVLITLMNGLNRERYAPTLVSLKRDGALRALVAADIPVIAPYDFRKVSWSIPFLTWLWRTKKPDIVMSTMAHMNFAVLLTRFFMPRKTRVFVREAITPSYMDGMTNHPALVRWLYRLLYPLADTIICPADIIIDQFKSLVRLHTNRFALLYNPVDVEKITRQIPAAANKETSIIHFVCAGRLHPQKGFDRLIESLAVAKIPFDWRLDIWGEGDKHAALSALIGRHGLNGRVFLRGYTGNPWAEMAQADAFLLPSRYEGLPNVALESLTVGTPVIAMNSAGGIHEIAALATPGTVTVCGSMDEFIAAAARVTPKNERRGNLLPPTFHPDSVMRRFEEILSAHTTHRRA